jgi:hypothetical protein
MTPAQMQQKLDGLRSQKSQIDADISAMASSVDAALKPIRENRNEIKKNWGDWQSKHKYIARKRWAGEKKGETRMRVIFQLRLGRKIAEAYVDAWEAAPKAIQNIEELIGDLIGANDQLQKAKAQILAVQIPPSVSSPSQLAAISTALNAAKASSNQTIDAARAILSGLPGRRSKIKPLITAALKAAKLTLETVNKKEDTLEDRKINLTPDLRKARLDFIDKIQGMVKPFYEVAKKTLKEADDFVDSAPAREQSIKSKQIQINSKFSSIQSGLSLAPGGSPNRAGAGPGDVALHLLAIGAVAAGICAFDYHERRA